MSISTIKKLRAEISEADEFFGKSPRYPLASIETYIDYASEQQQKTLQKVSSDVAKEIQASTQNITGTIEDGFGNLFNVQERGFKEVNNRMDNLNSTAERGFHEVTSELYDINYKLGDILYKIGSIRNILDWKLSSLIEETKLANVKLEEIISLLNVPDFQKERKYYIEQGIDFFVKSNASPELIDYAISNFQKALEREYTDYFVHNKLGVIYMFFKPVLDVEKARKHLEESIKLGQADVNFNHTSLGKYPSSIINFSPVSVTSNSLMYLAKIYHLEDNNEKAYQLTKKGYSVNPDDLRVGFDLAKYAVLTNRTDYAIQILDEIIEKDRYITLKVLTDNVLPVNNQVRTLLNKKSKDAVQIAENVLSKILNNIHPNSIHRKELKKIERIINKKNYLASLKALELIGYKLKN